MKIHASSSEDAETAIWSPHDRKALAIALLSISNENLHHVRDCSIYREMCWCIQNVSGATFGSDPSGGTSKFLHCYNDSWKLLCYINHVRQLCFTLKSMTSKLIIDNKEPAMAVQNEPPKTFEHLIVAVNKKCYDCKKFLFDFVKSCLVQNDQQ